MINCPECEKELGEIIDTTHSNVRTDRAEIGQHTGDIYRCDDCESYWIESFLDDEVTSWTY